MRREPPGIKRGRAAQGPKKGDEPYHYTDYFPGKIQSGAAAHALQKLARAPWPAWHPARAGIRQVLECAGPRRFSGGRKASATRLIRIGTGFRIPPPGKIVINRNLLCQDGTDGMANRLVRRGNGERGFAPKNPEGIPGGETQPRGVNLCLTRKINPKRRRRAAIQKLARTPWPAWHPARSGFRQVLECAGPRRFSGGRKASATRINRIGTGSGYHRLEKSC